MTEEKQKEIAIEGHDIRIPMPNDDDFDERVEWQIDSSKELKPGETKDPTHIFYREEDVRQYLCWQMLRADFSKTIYFNCIVRRCVRLYPKGQAPAGPPPKDE